MTADGLSNTASLKEKHEHKEDSATAHSCEFASGSLFRFIEFPARINAESATAKFRNGMLTVIAEVAKEEKVA